MVEKYGKLPEARLSEQATTTKRKKTTTSYKHYYIVRPRNLRFDTNWIKLLSAVAQLETLLCGEKN